MADDVSCYSSAIAVTPADTGVIAASRETDGLYFVGTATTGALAVIMADGSTQTFTGLVTAVGQILPLRVKQVKSTGTTVTGIIALFK